MTMYPRAFVSTVAVLLAMHCLPATAQSLQKARQADFIVVLVNSEPITNSEVRSAVARTVAQMQAQKQPIPNREELRNGVLERMINDRAQLQQATEMGLKVEDFAVDQAEESMALQSQISVEALRLRLAKEGIDPKEFRQQLRDQLTLTRLREREVDNRVKVTDQDVDRFISEELAKNNDPLKQDINIAQILFAVPESASSSEIDAIAAQAQKVLERVRAGEDFATLVKEFSAADKKNGGQLGLRRGDRYPALFINAVKSVPVGGYSELVRSPAGFHILAVVERRASANLPNSTVQTHARHILLRTGPELSQAAALARLADYRERIVAGKDDFQNLAREFSQDGSAAKGGDLGWSSPGMFVPEFEEVLGRLRDGEIAAPMVSRFGVHLIQLLERRRTELSPREVREMVRARLRETKLDETYTNWAKDIRERAFVEMREPPA